MAQAARRERGFALLIVLWTLVLLTLLFTQLTATGRSEARIAGNLRAAAAISALAAGVVYQGLYHLLDSSAGHWDADGQVHEWRVPGGTARLVITSDAGFINPNSAPPELLQALLQALGTDAATAGKVAAAIVGWRTPDAQAAIGPDAYRSAGLGYVPPQSPFQSIDELALVLGMTPELLARLRPHLSIYNAAAPDPAFADPVVRQALREQGAAPGAPGNTRRMPRNVRLTATVSTAAGVATRQAEFRLNPPGDGKPFELLAWQAQLPPSS